MPLRADIEETLHGVTIVDPYRWLEDRSSDETDSWIHEQQLRCDAYFDGDPHLVLLQERVRRYLDVEVVDQPAQVNDRYFYRKRREGEEQGCLYVRDTSGQEERRLVDPRNEGPYASVGIHAISDDGAYVAYELRRGGEDRKQIRFVDVSRGVQLTDFLERNHGRGLVFWKDGFFYGREGSTNQDDHTICYHRFGTRSPDRVVFRAASVAGNRLLLLGNAQRLGALLLYPGEQTIAGDFSVALPEAEAGWREVFHRKPMPYSPILHRDRLFVLAAIESDRSRLLELSFEGAMVRTVIEKTHSTVRKVVVLGDRIFLHCLDGFVDSIEEWTLDGEYVRSLELPGSGTVQMVSAFGASATTLFYRFESFTLPPAFYQYFPKTGTSILWHSRSHCSPVKDCWIERTSIVSGDGTSVPLTLVGLKPPDRVHPRPMIMTGYGGFGARMTPQFSVLVMVLLELGASFALPSIRGGGELGESWHHAGRKRNRQASFDDFLAAAEWLCREGYTTPSQLGIFGGSHSGLLVGAAMTQRPDLFGAVLCIAPLLDMLRYEQFGDAGRWRYEYGTVEDSEDFHVLQAYSPYHRIDEQVEYPAAMFVSGDKDERCDPAHARKMVARLQDRAAQKKEVILDYHEERGHSPVLPLSVRIAALTRRIAFLCRQLHIAVPDGGAHEAADS